MDAETRTLLQIAKDQLDPALSTNVEVSQAQQCKIG